MDYTVLGIAFVLALLAGIGVRQYFVNQMSNVRPEAAAWQYLDQHSIQIDHQDDTFLYLSVQRIPKPKAEDPQHPDDFTPDNDFDVFDDDDDPYDDEN